MTKQFDVVAVHEVRVGTRKRKAKGVDRLKNSIAEIGLLNPITVTAVRYNKGGAWHTAYRLVAGNGRLEACKALGWQHIPAFIRDLDEIDSEIAEIDENLVRNELTVLERGEQFLRRKELYEAKHPETRHGANLRVVNAAEYEKWNAERSASFVDDTAEKTGVAPRTITEDVQIAAKIDSEVKQVIRDTALADKKKELIRLARIAKPEVQARVAEIVAAGEADGVGEALARLRGKRPARAPRVKTFALPFSPEKAAAVLLRKFSREQLQTLLRIMVEKLGEDIAPAAAAAVTETDATPALRTAVGSAALAIAPDASFHRDDPYREFRF
ncbi:MAG: ParB/RepB/Spo0J family partition protein [Alphaproteobacteria bacterium]